MRHFLTLLLLLGILGVLGGCGGKSPVPLENLPEDYGLEQAKKDGVVLHENGDITSGQEVWEAFAQTASAGKPASVRLGFYHTLDDPSRYAPEYYESVKDDYPLLFILDLAFDGASYTLTGIENGERWTKPYACLVRYENDAPERASYDRSISYALLNDKDIAEDETMTYERLFGSLFSARLEDHIDFHLVYMDYICDN